ncbi:MAG: hypothetical protein HYS17_11900 [Micavibrio aeruginosavorus]|uniref:AsmA-like C-terminal domain-containing protein n=1 Tax=Micavibrio aeruginosavorus TaxID=349221 RepID=A0A7T5R253_9BACT|nr:MAG: hypothetical protein HYS17_11900 [Micavibrio aeruginosavorus]
MILFFDDEKPLAPLTGARKHIRRFIKVLIVLAVLLGISLWVLKSLGGNSHALKLGMQDYLTDATGYIAQVDSLQDMSFFPMSHLAFDGLSLHEMIEKQRPATGAEAVKTEDESGVQAFPHQKTAADFFDAGAEVASLRHANVTMSFWDVFFSRRRFYDLEVQGLRVVEGAWGLRALTLESLSINDEDTPVIAGTGAYGGHPFSLRVDIQKDVDAAGRKRYKMPDKAGIEARWGDLDIVGVLDSSPGKDVHLKIERLSLGKQNFSGDIVWGGGFKGDTLSAALGAGDARFVLELLTTKDNRTSGTLEVPVLDTASLPSLGAAYNDAMRLLLSGPGSAIFPHKGPPVDLTVKIADIRHQGKALGHLTARIAAGERVLDIDHISGLLAGGALGGDIRIERREEQWHLAAQGKLRGWDYAVHEGKTSAQFDVHADLEALAPSWSELLPALSGEMIVVAEPGEWVAADMLYKSGEAWKALRKGDETTAPWLLSCGFADLAVESGKAIVQRALFAGRGMTLGAEGAWDMKSGRVDVTLTPYMEDESARTAVFAVTMRGVYPDLKISRGQGGRRLSDLPVPAPDFSRIKPGDIALPPQHPCRSYLGEPQP